MKGAQRAFIALATRSHVSPELSEYLAGALIRPSTFCLFFGHFQSLTACFYTLCFPDVKRCNTFQFFLPEWTFCTYVWDNTNNKKSKMQQFVGADICFRTCCSILQFLICNLALFWTFLVYEREDDPIPKRARRAIGTLFLYLGYQELLLKTYSNAFT